MVTGDNETASLCLHQMCSIGSDGETNTELERADLAELPALVFGEGVEAAVWDSGEVVRDSAP